MITNKVIQFRIETYRFGLSRLYGTIRWNIAHNYDFLGYSVSGDPHEIDTIPEIVNPDNIGRFIKWNDISF